MGEEGEFKVGGNERVEEVDVVFVVFKESGVDGFSEDGVGGVRGHVEGVEEGV